MKHVVGRLTWLAWAMVSGCATMAAHAAEPPDWQRDVRPLLAAKCFACHGPDEAKREADLRLDDPAALTRRRDSGQLVVPRQLNESLLWQRVSSTDADERMPPAPDHRPLTPAQLQTIQSWILAGANTTAHWSHQPIRRPALPPRREDWVRNEIDLLLQDDFKQQPPQPLDAARLARRMSLTLTGRSSAAGGSRELRLDGRSSAAGGSQLTENIRSIRRFADQLLASPAYGEHMAVSWLDLARYADTHGYHIDGAREMWRWRDWVIDAFNEDMPFDQFTRWQVAGDLLPPTDSAYQSMQQRLATGFFRNTPVNSEDGAIDEEFLAEYAAERTIALGAAWLGHTLQCCRCHDHKNDLTLQREFYQLSAFFNDLPEKGIDGRHGNAAPLMPAPTRQQARQQRKLQNQLDSLRSQQQALLDSARDPAQVRWETQARDDGPRPGPQDVSAQLLLNDGRGRKLEARKGPAAILAGPAIWLNSSRKTPGEDQASALAISLSGNTRVDWRLPPGNDFTVAAWVFLTSRDPMTLMATGTPPLQLRLNKKGVALVDDDQQVVAQAPPPGQWKLRTWRQVAWTYQRGRHSIWFGDQRALQYDEPKDPTARTGDARSRYEVALHVSIGGAPSVVDQGMRGLVDEISAFARALSSDEIARLAAADPLMIALEQPFNKRTKQQRDLIRREYLLATDAAFQLIDGRLEDTREQMRLLKGEFPSSMVMMVGDERPTHVLHRGDYRQPRERVRRGTPSWLPPLKPSEPGKPTRLDLANWLVSPDNPLTARVVANRIWQQHFGVGLTSTSDDFGLGGEAPTHPELLDFLADELIRSGWSQKHLHRLIVTSAVFAARWDSLPQPGPWRQPALTAEMTRDDALSASGLLVDQVGGPGVFPYQPPGLWEELARHPNLYSAQVYREDDGAGLYRRSVYTFWKRSAPPPTLSLLGAPNRETCVAMRTPSTGAQRALVTLNDPIYIESSRRLAQRVLLLDVAASKDGEGEQIRWGFDQLLQRSPTKGEQLALTALLRQLEKHFHNDPAAAENLLSVGRSELPTGAQRPSASRLAAWTMWCNTLMNTREFQTIP